MSYSESYWSYSVCSLQVFSAVVSNPAGQTLASSIGLSAALTMDTSPLRTTAQNNRVVLKNRTRKPLVGAKRIQIRQHILQLCFIDRVGHHLHLPPEAILLLIATLALLEVVELRQQIAVALPGQTR